MADGQRCAAIGCGRFVRRGERFCSRHAPPVEPLAIECDDDAEQISRDDGIAKRRRHDEFRQRLASGDYHGLIDAPLREILAQAAAERGLADEIGALRVVLARVLTEVEDPAQQAAGIARITSATVQAARAQRALSGEQVDGLITALTQILAELDE